MSFKFCCTFLKLCLLYRFQFQNIKESDAGRYMCRARDSTGQIAQSNSDVIVNGMVFLFNVTVFLKMYF